MKLFTKRWVFSFLASFLATLVVGFFVWNIFVNPNSSVLSSQVFTGAISSNYIETVPAASDFVPDISEDRTNLQENLQDTSEEDYSVVIEPSESTQDQLDDIQEKLDLISQQVSDLLTESQPTDEIQDQEQDEKLDEKNEEEQQDEQDENQDSENQNNIDDSSQVYPKILISEVQAVGLSDDKQEFVELYNLNNEAVSLTGWYLQRKTASASSWSSYAASSLFSGKIIYPGEYFLIARTGYYPYADIFTDNAITNDNSFALKNPNGEISDKLGFGNAADPESAPAQNPGDGQSIGRKTVGGVEQDFDNNLNDFELQTPTPKMGNITYVPPPAGGGGGGGGSTPVVYPKILISEVQTESQTVKDEFIELYNPNSQNVDLTGWVLKKKTSGGNESNLVSSSKFSGVIHSGDYFLIAPQVNDDGSSNYQGSAPPDLFYSGKTYSITGDNTVLLYDPNGNLIDKVGFDFAQDFETAPAKNPPPGKSSGRIWDEALEEYKNIGNNSLDFEIDTPTPKAQNIAYVEPSPSEPIDITPPEVNFNLEPTQTEPAFLIDFTITDLAENVSPSGLASYIFRWQEDGDSGWQEDASIQVSGCPTSADLTRDFEDGEDGKTYNFQVQARDADGNTSDWLPEIPAQTRVDITTAQDTDPPVGMITINNGAKYTNTRDVTLTLFAEDASGVAQMKFSNGGRYSEPEPYSTTKLWTLSSSGDGIKNVRVKFVDGLGNESSPGILATIILDTAPPVITLNGDSEINLNVGDEYEDLGAAVFDLIDAACPLVISGDIVSTVSPANFNIFYDATDSAGNNAEQVARTVIVE